MFAARARTILNVHGCADTCIYFVRYDNFRIITQKYVLGVINVYHNHNDI